MRSLLVLWIVCHGLYCQEVYFSEQRKNNDLFWKFEIQNFAHKSGFLYTKIVFADGEVNSSRQRLLIQNNRVSYIYGPITKKVLSGTYELQMLFAYKKIRENYTHQYVLGNPFQKKQQQLRYIDFFEKFMATIREIQTCLSKDNCDVENCRKLLKLSEAELNDLSLSVLAPYFPQSILHATKITQLQTRMLIAYQRGKKTSQYQALHQNIEHYLSKINAQVTPSFDDNSVKEDLLWCDNIVQTLQQYMASKKHRRRHIQIMYDYFSLETQHLEKRELQYKQSAFCQKEIYPHFAKITSSIQKLTQLHFANLSNKYQVKIKLQNIPTQSPKQIKSQYDEAVQKIQQVLQDKQKAQDLYLQELQKRYLTMFEVYKKAKVSVLQNGKISSLHKLKDQLQQLPPQLPLFRRNMANMIYFVEKIYQLREQNDTITSVYISQYNLYIQDLEKFFEQKSK